MKIVNIGSIAKVFNGYAFKSTEYSNEGFQVIRITNVQKGYISNSNKKFIKLENKLLDRFILKEGDILISLTGNVGRVGRMKNENLPAVLNQRVGKLIINSKQILPDYLFHFLNSNIIETKLINKAKGIAQKNIGSVDIENIGILLPSLEEQKRIVKILDEANTLKQKRKQAIELLDEYLKSVFLEMFGDPVKNEKGWEVKTLKDFAYEFKYGTNTISHNNKLNNNFPILRIPNIIGEKISYSDLKYSIIDEKEQEKIRLKNGDILFVRTNGNPTYIGRCAVYHDSIECGYASYLIRVRLKENSSINADFIKDIVSYPTYRHLVIEKAKTTAGNYNINTEGLKSLRIYQPPLQLQNQFGSITRKTEIVKQKMLAQSEEMENQFQALMQKSFSIN